MPSPGSGVRLLRSTCRRRPRSSAAGIDPERKPPVRRSIWDNVGILVRDRSSDFGGKGYVRVTLGTVAQTRRLLRELKAIL